MEDIYDYEFLYPGDSVKCIGGGKDYVDYPLSGVLACYGVIIRDLSLWGLLANVIVYKCIDGKRIKGYQFGIPPIHDVPFDNHLQYYLLRFRHSRDLVLRYQIKEDGSLGFPSWHTIFSGMYEIRLYKDWRFSLLLDVETQLVDARKDLPCGKDDGDVEYSAFGRVCDLISVLRYNGFIPTHRTNEVLFSAFEAHFIIHVHDSTLIMEGQYCPDVESVDYETLYSACSNLWIGGFRIAEDADSIVSLFYEFQENEDDIFSLARLIPQMAKNMHDAFERMMKKYTESLKPLSK